MSQRQLPSTGALPCIPLKFSSTITLVALIDSGSDVSYINDDAFNEVNASFGYTLDTYFIIGSAGYSNSTTSHLIFGAITLTAEVGDSSFSGKFNILVEESSLDFHVILGLDILKDIKAIFDFGNWQISAPRFIQPLEFLTPTKRCELMGFSLNEILDHPILDAE